MLDNLITKFLNSYIMIFSAAGTLVLILAFIFRKFFVALRTRWRLHRIAVTARPHKSKPIVVKDTSKSWPLPMRPSMHIVEIAVHNKVTYLKVAGYVVAVEGDPCRDPDLCFDRQGSPVLEKTWSAEQLKLVADRAHELLRK